MRQRTNPLAYLRRSKGPIGRALLPVLLLGSLGAAGSCPGMAAAAADEPPGHTIAHGGHGADRPGDSHSSDHAGELRHDHGACPHCGESGSPSGGHVLCAAFDEVANSKHAPKPLPLDLKHVKHALPIELAAVAVAPQALDESRRPDLYHRVFPPSVPLNLRHCVFII